MQRKSNDQFIQAYSEEFSEKVTLDFFDEHDEITGKDLLTITPSKQINFFILKILFKKWQEEIKHLESPYFDYKNNDVRRAMVQFMNTLSQHIVMGETELQQLMSEAVQETFRLSISASEYLINEFEEKRFESLSDKVSKPFLKYLKIRKEEFSDFLELMNGASLEEVLSSAEDNLSNDLIDSEIDIMNEVIPISWEEIFYEEQEDDIIQPIIEEEDLRNEIVDLGGQDDSRRLDSLYAEASSQNSEISEIGDSADEDAEIYADNPMEPEVTAEIPEPKIRKPVLTEPTEPTEPTEAHEKEPDSSFFDTKEPERTSQSTQIQDLKVDKSGSDELLRGKRSNIDDESKTKQDDISEPEIERTQQKEDRKINLNIEVAEASDRPTLNDRFQKEESSSLAEKHNQNRVDSILNAISVNHRYMFTKELFDGDRDAFHEAISKIEKRNSFDDAVEMIVQSYAQDLSWDMNSEEVKELLKVVFRKFR
ncbi:MAG: hypothetical protein ACI93L_001249 [Cyclobacteriaceae bacterium]|jgi:hypothetical protein